MPVLRDITGAVTGSVGNLTGGRQVERPKTKGPVIMWDEPPPFVPPQKVRLDPKQATSKNSS
jgi:hypothetical protein